MRTDIEEDGADRAFTLGAILGGGSSRRMGRDKALVPVAGVTMVERVAARVLDVVDQAIVVGRTGTLAGLPCVPDDTDGTRGPLAGLATALGRAGAGGVLLVAVDHPFVRAATLRALVERGGGERAVVPDHEGHLQVACAFYPSSWRQDAAAEVGDGGSIRSLLARMPHEIVDRATWERWGEDGRSWFSVDDAAALAAGTARYL